MKGFASQICIFVLVLLFIAGCSNISSDMVATDYSLGNPGNMLATTIPIIECNETYATGILGSFSLVLTSEGTDCALIPIRTSAIGESYTVSGGAFFTITPCYDCLKLKSIRLDDNENIVVEFTIRHPFPKGDICQPPSRYNRLDLDLFDVTLVVAPVCDVTSPYSLVEQDVYVNSILNADGLTSDLAGIHGGGVFPFIICSKNPQNNRFQMGTIEKNFDVAFPKKLEQRFVVYLTMGYGWSAELHDRLEPVYYLPEFNRKAAWKIEITPPEGDDPPAIGNTWEYHDAITEYPVVIDIYDWNHGAIVADNFPEPENTDFISAASDVTLVQVEIPGMTDSPIEATIIDEITNGWNDPLEYVASFANENGLGAGEYLGLVKVLDSRVPTVIEYGGETDTLVHSPDGNIIEYHNISEFSSYQTFVATVVTDGGWVRSWGNAGHDYCGTIVTDDDGLIYLVGKIDGYNSRVADLDPGAKIDEKHGGPFLCKYDIDGNYYWGRTWGLFASAIDILITENDEIYISGSFVRDVDFDPGPGVDEYSTPGWWSTYAYISKFDNDGNYLWVRVWGRGSAAEIDKDTMGNIYATGRFLGTVDFDPGINQEIRTSTADSDDIFVNKFDSDGNFLWVQTSGGPDKDRGLGLTFENDGNIYITGAFRGIADFDPGLGVDEHTSNGNYDVFLAKYNLDGNFLWSRAWGGVEIDEAYAVICDSLNNVNVLGAFMYVVDFDPGSGSDYRASYSQYADVFISRFDENGNYINAIHWGGTGGAVPRGISIDISGNFLVTGYFCDSCDFDPGTESDWKISNGDMDIFLSKLDPNGNYIWSQTWGGDAYINGDYGYGVTSDNSGSIYLSGAYESDVDFDPGSGQDIRISNGDRDAFLLKIKPDGAY